MEHKIPTREQAYDLLAKYNKNDSLIMHALSVEAVMLHFADILGELEKQKYYRTNYTLQQRTTSDQIMTKL